MQRKFLLKIGKNAIDLTLFGFLAVLMVFLACYLYVAPQLPPVETLKEYRLQTPMSVYSEDQQLIANYGEKRRIPMSFDQIPERLNQALIATEDKRFYEHGGVDAIGLARAVVELVSTGQIGGGGSTITMQLARNFFLSFEQTFTRKTKEIFLSWKIERALSKEDILTLYWNKIDFSNRAYGIGAAAEVYYGKTIDQLDLPQLAILAGIPKGPTTHNPLANPEKAFNRRNHVLNRMRTENYISEDEYQTAIETPLSATYHGSRATVSAPYLAEMVRSEMIRRFGQEQAYTAGYRVFTTLDSKLQEVSRRSLRQALIAYDRRHGYRGAEGIFPEAAQLLLEKSVLDEQDAITGDLTKNAEDKLTYLQSHLEPEDLTFLDTILGDLRVLGDLQPGLVLAIEEQALIVLLKKTNRLTPLNERLIRIDWQGLSWARPFLDENRRGSRPRTASNIAEVGHLIRAYQDDEEVWQLGQLPNVKAGFVSLKPDDGALVSLVGGFDFNLSKFNNVTQAQRQLGSNIKPFIYSAALEKGYTAASVVNDAPFTKVDASNENIWRPKNSSGNYKGPTRLRKALSSSTNLVSIRLVNDITASYAVDYLSQLGFDRDKLPAVSSIALGTPSFSPLDLVGRYAIFANGGYRIEPYFIKRIEDSNGNIIFEHQAQQVCPKCEQLRLRQQTANGGTSPEGSLSERDLAEQALLAEIEQEQFDTREPINPENSAPDADESLVSEDLNFELKFLPEYPIDPDNQAPRVISEDNAYIMDSMMRDVIHRGTAAPTLRASNSPLLRRDDLAGKTGTTNDAKDAWFSGYNGDYVATAWVGNQKYTDPGLGNNEYGGKAALPIWRGFMEQALAGKPSHGLVQPDGIVTAKIDPETGLLAPAGMRGAIFEVFRQRHLPERLKKDPIKDPYDQTQKKQTDLF